MSISGKLPVIHCICCLLWKVFVDSTVCIHTPSPLCYLGREEVTSLPPLSISHTDYKHWWQVATFLAVVNKSNTKITGRKGNWNTDHAYVEHQDVTHSTTYGQLLTCVNSAHFRSCKRRWLRLHSLDLMDKEDLSHRKWHDHIFSGQTSSCCCVVN